MLTVKPASNETAETTSPELDHGENFPSLHLTAKLNPLTNEKVGALRNESL